MIATISKIFYFLAPRERSEVRLIVAMMAGGALLEVFSFGLIFPILAALADPQSLARFGVWAELITYIEAHERGTMLLYGLGLLVAMYGLKAAYLLYLAKRQTRFTFALQAALSMRLLSLYLRQPLRFHLGLNSSQLIRNVVNEVDLFTFTTVMAATNLLSELLVLASISAFLVFVEPLGSILLFLTFATCGYALHVFTSNRSRSWGSERQFHDGLRIQNLRQALGAVKDVILLGQKDTIVEQFAYHARKAADLGRKQNFLLATPRVLIELLAILALAILAGALLLQDRDYAEMFPIIGVFAAGAFRLTPSFNRIMSSLYNLNYSLPVIELLHREFSTLTVQHAVLDRGDIRLDHAIELKEVNFSYPGADSPSLSKVNLRIPRHSFVGIVGPSGSGKSTLVDVIAGLLQPTSGKVLVDGIDISACLSSWYSLIGYVGQTVYLSDDTLRKNIAFGIEDSRIEERLLLDAVSAAQLQEFLETLPDGLATVIGERGVRMSGGQRQRIGIARALYRNPSVLILDEATSALDTETERDFMAAVHALRSTRTILVVSHRLSTVAGCDLTLRVDNGLITPVRSSTQATNLASVVSD